YLGGSGRRHQGREHRRGRARGRGHVRRGIGHLRHEGLQGHHRRHARRARRGLGSGRGMNRRFPLPVRAVMIDLDGTLADTIPDLAVAANAMLRELGRPALEVAVIRTFVGKGIPNLVARTLTGRLEGEVSSELLEKALPIYERCYAAVNGLHSTLYPGVMSGLATLRKAGFPLACVTNKAGAFTVPLL